MQAEQLNLDIQSPSNDNIGIIVNAHRHPHGENDLKFTTDDITEPVTIDELTLIYAALHNDFSTVKNILRNKKN